MELTELRNVAGMCLGGAGTAGTAGTEHGPFCSTQRIAGSFRRFELALRPWAVRFAVSKLCAGLPALNS